MNKVPSAQGAIYISQGQRPGLWTVKQQELKTRPIIKKAGFQPLADATIQFLERCPRLV
jgi:hypothetical protein